METLAYLHLALASEEPVVNTGSVPVEQTLKLFEGLNWKKFSSRASIYFLSLAVSVTVLGMASQAFAQTVLRQGRRGSEVTALQQRLRQLRYFNGQITGYFGSQTKAAVIEFQRDNNLEPDGIVGSATNQVLFGVRSGRIPSTDLDTSLPPAILQQSSSTASNTDFDSLSFGGDTLQTGDRGPKVTALQERLRELGYFDRRPTGYFGPITRSAVIQFQRENGLIADGVVGSQTLAALELGEPEKKRYVVVVPGNEEKLRRVRGCVNDVDEGSLEKDRKLGSYVNAGEFANYRRATSRSEYLRSCGLDARVTRR